MTPPSRPPLIDDRSDQDKQEILGAIARLSEAGIRISVEQIHGREDLLASLTELTAEFRAASRDAMCPLVEVLRAEVQGIQTAILEDLRTARDAVIVRKAEAEVEERWEKRLMPFLRPAIIALGSAIFTLLVIHGEQMLKIKDVLK